LNEIDVPICVIKGCDKIQTNSLYVDKIFVGISKRSIQTFLLLFGEFVINNLLWYLV